MTVLVGPDLELQGAIVAALNASIELKALIGSPPRIFQDPPQSKNWPGDYVVVGDGDANDDSDQCLAATLIYPKLHVWSRTPGWESAKKIAAVIWQTLHNATLTLSENRCFSILLEQSIPLRDPDGITKHIALTYRARIETPAA